MVAAGEVTELLKRIRNGEEEAAARLMSLVYPDLKRIAANRLRLEQARHGLQTTDLVNEAYLRIFGSGTPVDWEDRAHFFAVVAQQVRHILVDQARKRQRGGHISVALDDSVGQKPAPNHLANVEITALDEALQRLEKIDARAARVVLLRFFGGLTLEEAAEVLRINVATVKRDWKFAKSWLFDQLKSGGTESAAE